MNILRIIHKITGHDWQFDGKHCIESLSEPAGVAFAKRVFWTPCTCGEPAVTFCQTPDVVVVKLSDMSVEDRKLVLDEVLHYSI